MNLNYSMVNISKPPFYPYMTVLKNYISGLPNPIFLLNSSTNKVLYSNNSAISKLQTSKRSDFEIGDYINFLSQDSVNRYAQLNHKWYQLNTHKFENLMLLELSQIDSIPDESTIKSWKNMIGVMLHRLRSPLTGINGYLDMLADEVDAENHIKRLDSIQKGFDNIYDIMDELEIFYNLSSEYDDSEFTEVKLLSILNDVLIGFNSEQKKRIKLDQSINPSILKHSNPNALKQIISAMLSNALEHSNDDMFEVFYSHENNGSISVKNVAEPLDPAIRDQIFYPFVTTRATNLGIGLSIALILALQIGGIIFFLEEDHSLKFTFQFPLS